MWDLLDFISPAVEYFAAIYRADGRREARRFTVGCFLVFVALVLLIGALFYYGG
jgi:O-antigen/teichoic acid export membrane protein